MMPDGSQNGQPTTAASADDAIAGYLSDLREARTILSEAYSFNLMQSPFGKKISYHSQQERRTATLLLWT